MAEFIAPFEIYYHVARFARWVKDAGFRVWMPHMFGQDGRPATPGYVVRSMARACISREFRAFAANRSSPIVDWLRALLATAHEECGGARTSHGSSQRGDAAFD